MDRVTEFVGQGGNVAGFAGPLSLNQFKGGQSNPTYQLVTPRQKYVLRKKPGGKLLPSAHAVDREYRVISALYPTGFPVARPYALCTDDSVAGAMFYVMEMVEGRIFWDGVIPDATPEHRRAVYEHKIATLAKLHTTDYATIGLSDYGKPGNYFARQIDRWTKQYKAAETGQVEEMDRLAAWLPTALPKSEATSIVHGDFRFDNVIMHPSEARVLAVLDWELSTLGHPLADFTYYLMAWHFPPAVRGGLAGVDIAALGIPGLEEIAGRYARRTGLDALGQLDFCLAYNMFRLAAIVQGVYARGLQGNASSEHASGMGAQMKMLAALAWTYAKKAGA